MEVLKKIGKVLLVVVSVICCFILFAYEISLHTIWDIKSYLSTDNIKGIIENIDLNSIINDIEIDDIVVMEDTGFKEETIKEIINSDSVKGIVADYVSSSVDAVFNDSKVNKPTVEEIMTSIKENTVLLENIAESEGVVLTEEQKQEFLSTIEDSLPDLIEEIPDISEDLKIVENGTAEQVIKFASNQAIIVLIVLIILTYLFISLCRFSLHKAMIWASIPTILSSVVVILMSISLMSLVTIIETDEQILKFIKPLLASLSNNFLISGLIGLVIGVGLIIGYVVIKKNKNQNKEVSI